MSLNLQIKIFFIILYKFYEFKIICTKVEMTAISSVYKSFTKKGNIIVALRSWNIFMGLEIKRFSCSNQTSKVCNTRIKRVCFVCPPTLLGQNYQFWNWHAALTGRQQACWWFQPNWHQQKKFAATPKVLTCWFYFILYLKI